MLSCPTEERKKREIKKLSLTSRRLGMNCHYFIRFLLHVQDRILLIVALLVFKMLESELSTRYSSICDVIACMEYLVHSYYDIHYSAGTRNFQLQIWQLLH